MEKAESDLQELKTIVAVLVNKVENLEKKIDKLGEPGERCVNHYERVNKLENRVDALEECENLACKNLTSRVDDHDTKFNQLVKLAIVNGGGLLISIIGFLVKYIFF